MDEEKQVNDPGWTEISSEDVTTQGPGTWVRLMPIEDVEMGQAKALLYLGDMGAGRVQTTIEDVYDSLSEIILDWNWHDKKGKPLPQAKEGVAVFDRIRMGEWRWLVRTVIRYLGEEPAPKNK